MTGFVLGLCFAVGVSFVLLGLAGRATPTRWRLQSPGRTLLDDANVPMSPPALAIIVAAVTLLGGLVTWSIIDVPIVAAVAACGCGWAPLAWLRARRDRARRERERAWPAAIDQLADAMEAGLALPAGIALVAHGGPEPLRADFAAFHARLRASGLSAAVDALAAMPEQASQTVALLLRAGLVELPAGGLAPALRDLASVLSERFETREKARSRSASLQLEAAVLAVSPAFLLMIVGLASPAYLDAYRTPDGTLVGVLAAVLIAGCYALMRRLGRVPEPNRSRA